MSPDHIRLALNCSQPPGEVQGAEEVKEGFLEAVEFQIGLKG